MSRSNPSIDARATNALSGSQILIVAVTGITLWFAAAILIRALQPIGILDGAARLWTGLLTIPGTLPLVILMRRIARLGAGQLCVGYALATGIASLCDGIALTIVPGLYGADTAAAGAVILWGAGVGIMLAFLMDRRD